MEKLIIEKSRSKRKGYTLPTLDVEPVSNDSLIPRKFLRKTEPELPEVSEIDIARHYLRLSRLNYNIEEGFYPLGSCTMKYNPKVNEKVASLPGFADLHPCTPERNSQGALQLMYDLGEALKAISGLMGVTLQPAAGSQGEFTGILMMRAYHLDRGDTKRDTILIPDSAHGTNPASGAIGGFKIVSVKSNDDGRIDLEDLKLKATDEVAALMLTNPNTLGLFEGQICEIEKIVHDCGGLMYMDGANLNALLGIVRPGDMNFDCMHINLHKTFSTPHGGGGPGSGPVCVSEKLLPFLPVPRIIKNGDKYALETSADKSVGKVHSFFGNFGMFVRAYTYIRMYGAEGLHQVSCDAVLNANYLFSRLKDKFDVPHDEYCMHEFTLSGDRQKKAGASTKDIAKRLLDYGFHAPTIYFPLIVHEALLIEPTETESKESIDSFADAMLAIDEEIKNTPEVVLNAPSTTPMRRLDDALAARQLNISWVGK
ncbi:MAG: Glycine dehydrogenase (decarboxylating) [Ignavibacteria bacterium]|nr:Glycine dehydrogenase (decarboxylating) [Ignavibacteria bacterium]